ncbi:MAG: hypothetical protein ACLGI6_05675 [Gammaproteobacteria bacterium]
MKSLIASFLVFCSASACAAESQLLENALSCKLKDSELASLMRELAVQQPAFAKPAKQYGAPSADVYQLPKPVSALGYSSSEIVITPARILLAVPGEPMARAIGKLKLKEEAFSPASRPVRPTVSVVAFQLSHQGLQEKLLVGCEYANPDAAQWPR